MKKPKRGRPKMAAGEKRDCVMGIVKVRREERDAIMGSLLEGESYAEFCRTALLAKAKRRGQR